MEGKDIAESFLAPPSSTTEIAVEAGVPLDVRVDLDTAERSGPLDNALSVTLGTETADADPEMLITEAAKAARKADVAVVVVGTNARVESEGYDRTTLDLPGLQDRLVHAVAAANPRTIVIVNAGSPVIMPWRHEVAAILIGYFGGQEFGNALTDILTGTVEPGGRLPTTWPATQGSVPVLNTTPDADGKLRYDEGIHIGYRAWLKTGATPAYEFGYGLGYTTWTLDTVDGPDGPLTPGEAIPVSVTLTNKGERSGKQVVQVYAEKKDSAVERPVRWLIASTPVWAPTRRNCNRDSGGPHPSAGVLGQRMDLRTRRIHPQDRHLRLRASNHQGCSAHPARALISDSPQDQHQTYERKNDVEDEHHLHHVR
ncbi:hypothetical protein StoSoilB13_05330 [Arthrobacter sp. StoSoilB13]|nr:hypothetical protein StoSoilB13_05330 [Arthrobacter sp. StoSoilB13]